MADHVFHRDLLKEYPVIDRAQGVYLYDTAGKQYLDASAGAVAVNLGHGVEEIIDAMHQQASRVAFVHTLRFETEVMRLLAEEIATLAPSGVNRVFFTSGGSEANESAIKLARQYHVAQGNKDKYITIGHWQSYHGNTLGSLSVGGDVKRRQLYMPMLSGANAHLPSPHCLHCPYQRTFDTCMRDGLTCIDGLLRLIHEVGQHNISSVILEPVVGSQQGAVALPPGYLEAVRAICDKYDLVLIADEVMTGFGRTGMDFAVQHTGVTPDIITFGKGVSSGYAPLGGMIVSDQIVDTLIRTGQSRLIHGYTFSGHPVSAAAGLAAVRYYRQHQVLDNCRTQGAYLMQQLQGLRTRHASMGDIRGKGLLIGFDLVSSQTTNQTFAASGAADQLNDIAMTEGAVFYPGSGGVDGNRGEHLLIGPPLTIVKDEIDEMMAVLDRALYIYEQHHAHSGGGI